MSVGQSIVASARSASAAADRPPGRCDAGRVRMLVTQLRGRVTGVWPASQLAAARDRPARHRDVRLRRHRHHGGGDADPNDYEVARARSRSRSSSRTRRPRCSASLRRSAPHRRTSRAARSSTGATASALGIGWGLEGTTAPFFSMDPIGLVLDLGNPSIGSRHHLLTGERMIDLLDLPASPTTLTRRSRGCTASSSGVTWSSSRTSTNVRALGPRAGRRESGARARRERQL